MTEGDFLLTVTKVGGEQVSGRYSYLSALARLESASGFPTFCHAELTGPGSVWAVERAGHCPHPLAD